MTNYLPVHLKVYISVKIDVLIFKSNFVLIVSPNAGRIHSVRIDNSTFERVEEFKYLGTTLKKILLRNNSRAG